MHPAYQAESVPWHLFFPHVHITSSSRDEPEFSLHDSSTMEAREADFALFAGSLASAISDNAERRRSTVPKPNAPVKAWRDMGIDDDALFPDEYLSRVAGMNHPSSAVPDTRDYAKTFSWKKYSLESIRDHRAGSALLVVLMTEASDQFQFLAPLLRLAQSIRIELAAVSGLHYSLPPARSYNKDLDEGIVAYVDLTLFNYLLVNIFLTAMREGPDHSDLVRLAQHSQSWNPPLAINRSTGAPVDAASFEDRLHLKFWRTLNDDPRQTASELLDEIRLYSFRCFDFLVAWYAVMMESFLTRRALDRTYPAYFGPEQLTAVILLQLQKLGSAFSVPSLDACDPVAFVHRINTASSVSVDSITDRRSHPVDPVPFLSLPPELHLHILSYLPTRALFPIMSVCTQLRNVCPELIYMDPLKTVDDFHPDHSYLISDPGYAGVISRRFSKLLALLLARPELCLRLRAFILRTCDVPEHPKFGRSKYGFNINESIVERMINLSHIELLVPHPMCAHCADQGSSWCRDRLQSTIPDIRRRWPHLRALTISYLPRDVALSSVDHDATESLPQAPHLESLGNPWRLQSLEVKQSDHSRDAVSAERQDLISLRHLVKMSAHSLRRLELHPLSLGALGDIQTFPVCPMVEDLSLRSALTAPLLQQFLERCFSGITFLHVSFDTTFVAFSIFVEDFGHLDLSKCRLLRRATIDLYPMSGFPPCMESLDLGVGFNVNHIWTTSPTMKAVQFENKVNYHDGSDGDIQARTAFQSLGRAFPNLYCVDMVIQDYAEDKNSMMDTLSSIVASSVPNLGILILKICYGLLCSRPCRSDFPIDDGGDGRQHDYAIVFFRACPSLNLISFNGVPSEDPPAFMQPDRVWKRATVDGEVEAHMTGRESLPWKGQIRSESKRLWLG